MEQRTPAREALIETFTQRSVTVLALGPLTNIATMILTDRQLASSIERIVFVGGPPPRGHRFTVGDHGPLPDFDVECDRRACEVILDTEIPLTLTWFEVCTHATLTPRHPTPTG